MNWAKLKRACIGSNWRNTLIRAAILGIVTYTICTKAFMPFKVQGESMQPLYNTGDFGFLNALVYRWSDPKRSDIVAIRVAGRNVMFLKRVIGLPNEKLDIRGGVVYIDGKPLDEPYIEFNARWNLKQQAISADEYFVIGDNRGMPLEQHKFGKVKRFLIAGRM